MSHHSYAYRPSPAEIRRMEDDARRNRCDVLISRIKETNSQLLEDLKIDNSQISKLKSDTHEGLIAWEKSLNDALAKAENNQMRQREIETKCDLLAKRIMDVASDLSNPDEFKVSKPYMSTFSKLTAWKEELSDTLDEAEFKRQRDAGFLKKNVDKKLKLSNVNLSMKEQSRISDIQYARRMDKLDKLAKCIAQIEDEQTRESFVLETNPLLDMERDDEFDDMIIEINTRVRSIKKVERRRAEAMEEAERIAHIKSPDAPDIIAAAAKVSTQAELSDVKKRVAELLQAEQREANDRHVRRAIRETLKEMGYEEIGRAHV